MLKTRIADGLGSGNELEIIRRGGRYGVVAFTESLSSPVPRPMAFTSDVYGSALNQDASFGGTPIGVYDGQDTAYWTGTVISGTKWTADSTDQANTGTRSLKLDNGQVGDIFEFDKGSPLATSSYIALSLFIYVDDSWLAGDSIIVYGWDTALGAVIGTPVGLENYFDFSNFDTWQSVAIPFSDMGLQSASIDAFRLEIATKSAPGPTVYFDDIQVEETGGNITFQAKAAIGTIYRVRALNFVLADALVGTLANGAGMIPLSYNKILDLAALDNGILLRYVDLDGLVVLANMRTLSDMLFASFSLDSAYSDGTNSLLSLTLTLVDDLILDSRNQGRLELELRDNLSGLLEFRASVRGRTEAL